MNRMMLKNRYFTENVFSMKSSTVRKEIHEYVDHADERFLALVHSMVQAEKKSRSQSENLQKLEMIRRAEQSEKEITEGKTISAEQFNADFQQWKKEKRLSTK
jgi:23S rRNA pseudoU1915 N3-methylase RlmH